MKAQGLDLLRKIALALPGVEERPCFGTPGFRVRGKFICRLKEDGDSVALRIDFDTRDALLEANPEAYYVTDHYRGYPAILVRLSKVDPSELAALLEETWRKAAPKKLVESRGADDPRVSPRTSAGSRRAPRRPR